MLKTVRRTLITLVATMLAASNFATAQDPTPQSGASGPAATISVYLDCDFCDFDHIRTEIAFVNWVTDPAGADVHLLATRQSTGGGGTL